MYTLLGFHTQLLRASERVQRSYLLICEQKGNEDIQREYKTKWKILKIEVKGLVTSWNRIDIRGMVSMNSGKVASSHVQNKPQPIAWKHDVWFIQFLGWFSSVIRWKSTLQVTSLFLFVPPKLPGRFFFTIVEEV